MHRHNQLPQEGPSKGKHGPQRVLRNTPRVGMLAVHKDTPLVLRDTAPRLPKQGPPWGITGEPEGTRPFEADNEGNAVGHFGHHKRSLVALKPHQYHQHLKYQTGHLPQAHTHHCSMALKPPASFTLRPIIRARTWQRRRTRWQRGHLCQHEHVTPHHTHNMHDSNTSHASHIPSCASQIKPCFPSLHARCILFQFPNCV